MTTAELITLVIASAALITSGVSAFEMILQRTNAVRPVLVLLDKRTDHNDPTKGRTLYLVNTGQAVAIDVVIDAAEPPEPRGAAEPEMREIAPGRRRKLAEYAEGSETPFGKKGTHLRAQYLDVNGTEYESAYDGAAGHTFRRIGRLPPWRRELRRMGKG